VIAYVTGRPAARRRRPNTPSRPTREPASKLPAHRGSSVNLALETHIAGRLGVRSRAWSRSSDGRARRGDLRLCSGSGSTGPLLTSFRSSTRQRDRAGALVRPRQRTRTARSSSWSTDRPNRNSTLCRGRALAAAEHGWTGGQGDFSPAESCRLSGTQLRVTTRRAAGTCAGWTSARSSGRRDHACAVADDVRPGTRDVDHAEVARLIRWIRTA